MKKAFAGFMAILTGFFSICFNVSAMDTSDQASIITQQTKFERDLPQGGIDKLETYSDGTKILYVSVGKIKAAEEDYYRVHSESSSKVRANTLSTARICGHLIGTGAILIAGTVATVYTCGKIKEADEQTVWTIAAILEGLVTLGLSFITAKPVYNHLTRKSYDKPTAWDIRQVLAKNSSFHRNHYHVDGMVIVEIHKKTAEALKKAFYNGYGNSNIIHYAGGDDSLSCKGAYAFFSQKFDNRHDDPGENIHLLKQCLNKLGIKRNEYTREEMNTMKFLKRIPFDSPYTTIEGRLWWQRNENKNCYF